MKTTAIMELVAGYEAYADSDELQIDANADAPASTPVCGAATVSWAASMFSAKTVRDGC
ncbi:LxmA leader domain family RiPP [Streptomyces halobius]|uniref:LxmA leader domain family RiPP n=1 Tax=Streptomyces halobius TaxID=2879846 RepID=A0ABY4MAI7_9ACTN|nr:LxmA leader domain family RiPP [Streptomyces halobius]UQA94432.1 LxmA leader domain family RiPP [Streptomyces halobius]